MQHLGEESVFEELRFPIFLERAPPGRPHQRHPWIDPGGVRVGVSLRTCKSHPSAEIMRPCLHVPGEPDEKTIKGALAWRTAGADQRVPA